MILRLIAISLVLTVLCLGDTHNPQDAVEVKRTHPAADESEPARNPAVVLDSPEDLEALQDFDSDLDKLHSLIGKPNHQANRVGEQAAVQQ